MTQPLSWAYGYDGLDRLTTATLGTPNGTATGVTAAGGPTAAFDGQAWDYDLTGNWTAWDRDPDRDGIVGEAGEIETRGHNAVNELTQRTPQMSYQPRRWGATPLRSRDESPLPQEIGNVRAPYGLGQTRRRDRVRTTLDSAT